MGLKKLIGKVNAKGVFNSVFPKAENSKIGRLASGIINGATQATPLTFFMDFAKEFLDSDGDGEVTIKDFKDMDIKTIGKALGFLACLGLLYFLYMKYLS